MPKLAKRSYEPELMDDLSVDDDGLQQTLHELDIINQWLGGNQLTLNSLERLLESLSQERREKPIRIADLGCGSGDMLRRIQKRYGTHFELELIGIDANPAVTRFAKRKSVHHPEIKIITENVFTESFQERQFDIILCTLFLHHFTHEELVGLFAKFRHQVSIGLVVNDLHRHWFAYHSIRWLTQLFSRSYMTRYDASLSVKRGFVKQELIACMQEADWAKFDLQWCWAFRWQLVGYTDLE